MVKGNDKMNNYDKYIVQKGDSLYTIAKKYGTTIAEIVDVNTLTSNTLYPNQELFIPVKKNSDEVYVDKYITKNNDTIEKIAGILKVTPMELGKYNDFGKLILKEEQVIVIPKTIRTYKIEDGFLDYNEEKYLIYENNVIDLNYIYFKVG